MNLAAMKARRSALAAELQTAINAGNMDAVRALTTEDETLAADISALEAAATRVAAAQSAGAVAPVEAPKAEARLSAGAVVVRSDAFSSYDGKGQSARVVVEGTTVRALGASDVSTDTIADLDQPRRQGLVAPLDRPLLVMDLMDNQNTDAYSGSYVEEVSKENKAAFVAQGMTKPLQDFEFNEVPSTMRTVAAAAVITRQALRSPAQIQGLINGRLSYNLLATCDIALIKGTGTGAQPKGLLALENRNKVTGAAGSAEDGGLMAVAIRKGITQSNVKGRMSSDAVLVNPEDAEVLDIARAEGATGTWLITPNVATGGVSTLWGKRLVETEAVDKGTSVVGAFKRGVTVWHRDAIQYYASDSHEGMFLENKVVVLAEAELVPEWYRPQAFTEVTFTAAG